MDKVEELAAWLDAKYSRHREEEDQEAAAMLRSLRQKLAATIAEKDALRHASLAAAEWQAIAEQAIAERDRAVKDAERYRFLRDNPANWRKCDLTVILDLGGPDWEGQPLELDELDKTIDAAIAAGGEGTSHG